MFLSTTTPTTEIYTLSLHDALPIFGDRVVHSDFATRHHLGQQQRREYFCDRPNFKYGVAIERPLAARTAAAVRCRLLGPRIEQRDDDTDRLTRAIDTILQHVPDVGVLGKASGGLPGKDAARDCSNNKIATANHRGPSVECTGAMILD